MSLGKNIIFVIHKVLNRMIREDTVFGPIHSRRLGSSLGINLLPRKGKICNFDCIYCECGWNKDGRDDTVIPTAAEVRAALEEKLSQAVLEGTPIDSITFSGDGEPTLNPEFPQIIDDTLRLRDRYYPASKVTVLTNATRIHIREIADALKKVERPVLKLDAPTEALAAKINKPAPGYSIRRVIEAMKGFEGNFIMQTMFLRSDDFDSSSPEVLGPWMDIVREVKPRKIMVYTIDRPTPQEGLKKFTVDELTALVRPLMDEGFNIMIKG